MSSCATYELLSYLKFACHCNKSNLLHCMQTAKGLNEEKGGFFFLVTNITASSFQDAGHRHTYSTENSESLPQQSNSQQARSKKEQ